MKIICPPTDHRLVELLKKAACQVKHMSQEELEQMIEKQKKSWSRSFLGTKHET